MEPVIHVDPILNVYSILDGLFRSVVPNEAARKFFGIKAISEKLSGPPGYYLWFGEKPGAYLLELIDGTVEDVSHNTRHDAITQGASSRGRLRIKYFPAVDDSSDVFEDFSFYEQLVRMSDLFDGTGTPTFEGSEKIDDTYFVVGNLDMRVTAERELIEITLNAPDRWKTFHPTGLSVSPNREGSVEVIAPGGKDRDVQAWALSWFLFDKLISGFCYAYKTFPQYIAVWKKTGAAYYIDRDNKVVARPHENVKDIYLSGCFLIQTCDGSVPDEGCSNTHSDTVSVTLVNPQDGELVCLQDEAPKDKVDWINPEWWDARTLDISMDDTGFS